MSLAGFIHCLLLSETAASEKNKRREEGSPASPTLAEATAVGHGPFELE